MRMTFLRYLDQESHALWTHLETCLSQEGKKENSPRVITRELRDQDF